MSLAPQQTALFQLARRLCDQRGVLPLDLFDTLYEKLSDITPTGYRLSQCGCCGRRSVVPSGKALRDLRGELFTQKEVADRVAVKPQYISAIERDNRLPTEAVVAAYQALAAEGARRAVKEDEAL